MNEHNLVGRSLGVALLCIACAGGAQTPPAPDDAQRIEVFKPDGSVQCEPDTGTPPETMRAELETAGITVYDARSASDGMMHIQVCGSPTGRINVFTIDGTALDEAQALGFQPLVAPPPMDPLAAHTTREPPCPSVS